MDIGIHSDFIERLRAIDWFSHLFQGDSIVEVSARYYYVYSWTDARRLYRGMKWQNTILQMRNSFTIELGTQFPKLFDTTWNEFVVEAKVPLGEILDPVLSEMTLRHDLDKNFADCVQWDILGAMMEDVYRDLHLPSFFLSEMLPFYERGHFPCGWSKGKWPEGWLAVA